MTKEEHTQLAGVYSKIVAKILLGNYATEKEHDELWKESDRLWNILHGIEEGS